MNLRKILTEEAWDEVAPDCKGKDKELRRALLFYWSLEDDDFDFRCKALGKIGAQAGALKSAAEVKGDRDVVRYLTDMISASKEKQNELIKAKAGAEKALKAKAEAEKKSGAEVRKQEGEEAAQPGEEQDEDETGDSLEKLKRLLQSLKTSKVPYHFIACDAKPYGLVVSKKSIKSSAQHKKELARVAGGSTRPPKFGTCVRDGNDLIFEMEKPTPGLARVLQKWLKVNIGIPFKVTVGGESAEDEEESGKTKDSDEVPKFVPGILDGPEKAQPPLDMTAPFSISGSVGRGGKNAPDDVQAVQIALNRRAKAGLEVDGKCDPDTIKAIEAFQKALGQFKPDGRVDPGRGTARAGRHR